MPQQSVFAKELVLVRQEERRLLQKRLFSGGVTDKLGKKVPAGLETAVNKAFAAALAYFMGEGSPAIDKMLSADKLLAEFEKKDALVRREQNFAALRALDKTAGRSRGGNLTATTIEGAGLGLLGLGLPDIPLFLGVILKTVQETALRYGFPCKGPWEQSYFLRVICGGLLSGEEGRMLFREADQMAASLDHRSGEPITEDAVRMVQRTAAALSGALLVAKFIQGMAVVGAAGGAFNLVVLHRLEKAAAVKYKGRYLQKLEWELA